MRLFSWFIYLCLAGFLFAPGQVPAESPIDEWLRSIDDVNPSVIAARQKWLAAQAMTRQAGAWPDPMIGVDVERDNTRFSDYEMLEYMIEQEIPWPRRNKFARDIASLEAEATGFEMLEMRRQIRARIIEAAWKLHAARESARIAREQSALTDAMVESARARAETGQIMQSEWLRLEIAGDRLRNEAITMEREVDMALAMLNTLLNAEVDTPRPLGEMPALPEMNVSLKQLQDDARQYCCILMATLWREIASDLARKAAKLEQRPIVALRAEARQMRGNDSIDAYDTGITMSFPWLWGGKYEGLRAGAEAEYAMASAELQEEIAMTLADIQEMYTEAEMRLRNVRLYEDSVLPQTRALAESSREAYPAGMIPAMEMLDAQNMLLEAEMNYQKERAAYATAHAKLMAIAQPWTADEVATGLPLHGGEEQ